MQEIRFLYKGATLREIAKFILICIGASIFMSYAALHNEKGLVINGIIHLFKDDATKFYWIIDALIVAAILLLTVVAFKVIKREKIQRYIIFNGSAISLPRKPYTNEIVTFKYSDIKNIKFSVIKKKILAASIYYNGGQIGIHKSSVSENDFKQICDILSNITNLKFKENI